MNVSPVLRSFLLGAGAYGAFLGATEPANKPKNMQDAQQTAQWGNLGKRAGLDVVLGLADDAAIPLIALGLTPFIPGLKTKLPGIAGIIGVVGTGIAGAMVGHDIVNFLHARQYLNEHRRPGDVADANLSPIHAFANSGAGDQVRRRITGIASPSFQAVMNALRYNPVADTFASVIRHGNKHNPNDPYYADPTRNALVAANGIGSGLTYLALPSIGFGRSTALGSAAGVVSGAFAIARTNASGGDKRAAAVALGATYLPLLGTFTTLQAIRKFRGLGIIGKMAENFDEYLLHRGGPALAALGPKLEGGLDRALTGAISRVSNPESVAGFTARISSGIHGMAMRASEEWTSEGTWFSKLHGPMTKMASADPLARARSMANAYTGALGFVDRTAKFGVQQVAHALSHTAASSSWEQSLAMAHLISAAPHMWHSAHGIVTGTHHTMQGGRKTHATKPVQGQ